MTMRKSKSTCVVTTSCGDYCLDGAWIYLNHSLIHRDRAVFGDTADDFWPERWLAQGGQRHTGGSPTSDESVFTAAPGAFPQSAWRPFERGPRNCIGQELANIEARIAIAMLANRYAFTKVGLGELDLDSRGRPEVGDNGQYKVKSELYSVSFSQLLVRWFGEKPGLNLLRIIFQLFDECSNANHRFSQTRPSRLQPNQSTEC
jgi:hypothetical protein